MRICFLGTSHAAQHLSVAAMDKGFELVGLDDDPALIFVSEDTPTNKDGVRDTSVIKLWIRKAGAESKCGVPIILTSQVPPGFTRRTAMPGIFHQAETLRIKDAAERALHPEMMIVGCENPAKPLPEAYEKYLMAFNCPILTMSYESAEFAKMAINAFLISQVETTNMLSRFAERCGAEWDEVKRALQNDSRIGPNAYLSPGRWRDSKHLLRDFVSLIHLDPGFKKELLLEAWDA